MISKHSIVVEDIQTTPNFVMISCTIPNYKCIIKRVQVGESISTSEPIHINLAGFTSKWKIIFFPKGQFDFGVASENSRAYIKLMSCDMPEIKFNIKIHLRSSTALLSSSQNDDLSVFAVNDNTRSWAGPFQLKFVEEDDMLDDILGMKCAFKLIKNVEHKDTIIGKRSLCEVDRPMSSSKKTRLFSPPENDKDKHTPTHNHNVDDKDPPDPFNYRSPLTQHRSADSMKNLSYFPDRSRNKFTYREPSRKITTQDQSEVRMLPVLYSRLSLNRSENKEQNLQSSSTWQGSQCLMASDITGNTEEDKIDAEMERKVKSESDLVRAVSLCYV